MSMKKIILMSVLFFSFNGWAEDITVEHYSSEQTIKQGFPFSDAVRVDNTIYISGMIGEDDEGNLVEGGIVSEAHTVMKKMGNILTNLIQLEVLLVPMVLLGMRLLNWNVLLIFKMKTN